MAEDTAPDGGAEADRAAELLTRLLAESDFTADELVDRLQALVETTDPAADDAVVEPARFEELEAQIAELDARLAELDEEFQAKIEDVRKRVLQVKRLTDTKAPEDHEHDEFAELASQLETLSGEIGEMESRFNEGFENYESILEYLSDSLDGVEERLPVLAEAVIALRDEVDIIVEQATYHERLSALTETANAHGIRRARCESCSGKVDLSLLQEPRCPHCQSLFHELDANTGFFGAHTLAVEDAPALEGDTVDRTDLGAVLESATSSAPDEIRGADERTEADGSASPSTVAAGSDEDRSDEYVNGTKDADGDGFVFNDN